MKVRSLVTLREVDFMAFCKCVKSEVCFFISNHKDTYNVYKQKNVAR